MRKIFFQFFCFGINWRLTMSFWLCERLKKTKSFLMLVAVFLVFFSDIDFFVFQKKIEIL